MPNEICFNCTTPIKDCEWLTRGVPVPGWTARKKRGKLGDTYVIRKCPRYKPLQRTLTNERAEIGYCEVCGRGFIQNVVTGRHRLYCSATCKALAKLRRRKK